MIEPVKYRKQQSSAEICEFSAEITPDGWREAKCVANGSGQLKPPEVLEFTKLVKDLMKQCPDLDMSRKFFKKYGKKIGQDGMDPTMAFTVDGSELVYTVQAVGPSLVILPYRTKGGKSNG